MEAAQKSKQKQLKEERNYLESMIETYKTENKGLKGISESLEVKVNQLLTQLNAEAAKMNRIKDERSQECQQYQNDARQWKDKWELSNKEIRKL